MAKADRSEITILPSEIPSAMTAELTSIRHTGALTPEKSASR